MNTFQTVKEYYEPLGFLNNIRNQKYEVTGTTYEHVLCGKPEMSESQHAFLCGLIKKHKPQKLLEVGVAAGGTSITILNCTQQLGLNTKVYSVDLSERYYRDAAKSTGYLIGDAQEYGIDLTDHKLLLGKVVAARLEEIGAGIDFVVLDTVHALPGEVLDFLAVFPFLKKDAVIVLHDVANHFYARYPGYATAVLLQSVVADKFINNEDIYPNIAAFQLNDDTRKYIMDVFAALMMPWYYMPADTDLADYDSILSKHYPPECLKLYNQAKSYNSRYIYNANKTPYVELNDHLNIRPAKNILLYGTANLGRITLAYLKEHGIRVDGFVVSDGWTEVDQIDGILVYEFSKIPYPPEDTLIILTSLAKEPENNLKGASYDWVKIRI